MYINLVGSPSLIVSELLFLWGINAGNLTSTTADTLLRAWYAQNLNDNV